MKLSMTRREALTVMAGIAGSPAFAAGADKTIVRQHDRNVERLLSLQVTERDHPGYGAYPDKWGLYHCGSAARILEDCAAAFLNAQSEFYQSNLLFERMKLAAEFLERAQTPDGNIDLLITNFNSPPDTGFVVHHVARAAKLAAMNHHRELSKLIEPFLLKAGSGLVKGGIHTPNHRWVVCAALAQINELYPEPEYIERIDRWLSEGIDIDSEGQFTERSTTVYNAVCDNAFVTMAHKLNRPELLEPVRRNLDSMLYLLHPNGEAVTEISRRQDVNTRGGMEAYWFALRMMAIQDGNGQYASVLKPLEPDCVKLSALMEYPELLKTLPALRPIPDDYEKVFPLAEFTHIRRGAMSASIIHRGNSRWFSARQGEAVINAVRFASAFFGKGQFVPTRFEKKNGVFHFDQALRGPYYQPIGDIGIKPIPREKWSSIRAQRRQSEVARLTYHAEIKETSDGFELEIQALGTGGIPFAIEINLRKGGDLSGVQPAPNVEDAYLLKEGFAEYKAGGDTIRFGPGQNEHAYTQIRGADDPLPGYSVYLTGYTPFRHTLKIQCL